MKVRGIMRKGKIDCLRAGKRGAILFKSNRGGNTYVALVASVEISESCGLQFWPRDREEELWEEEEEEGGIEVSPPGCTIRRNCKIYPSSNVCASAAATGFLKNNARAIISRGEEKKWMIDDTRRDK